MAYLTPAELSTHIYSEIVDEITRNNASIAQDAIDSAIDMAKSYLHKYDLVALFGTSALQPTVDSPMLKRYVKDLACWHVVVLSNANIELELFDKLNDNAIKWLKDVQKGLSSPDWPYRDTTQDATPSDGDAIEYSSNKKRNNFW